jgi:hypothetical protein
MTHHLDELMRQVPGTELANVAFNWAQAPGYVLTQADCDMLHGLRLRYDAARTALRTAIAKALDEARGAWLPIETAPKDGAQFLGVTGTGSLAITWWLAAHGGFYAGGDKFGPYIWTSHGAPALCGWQPLPPAPTQPAAAGKEQ